MTLSTTDHLQPLRTAIQTGDADAIRAALPEPEVFFPALFALHPIDRDALMTAIFPVLDTEEDQWELIEAATMHSRVHPERAALVALAPLIPEAMLADVRADCAVPAGGGAAGDGGAGGAKMKEADERGTDRHVIRMAAMVLPVAG